MRYTLCALPHQSRQNCIQAVRDAPDGYTVQIEPPDKTSEQRKLFHALCARLGEEIGMHAGDVKEIAKAKLMGWRTVKFGGMNLVVADGHSEKLSRKKYSELIEVVYELAAEAGVAIN